MAKKSNSKTPSRSGRTPLVPKAGIKNGKKFACGGKTK